MDKLDGILTYLQRNPKPEPVRNYYAPEKVAAIIQQRNPGWKFTETELKAIDLMFNGSKWVLLMGNKGTGKTTLMRLVSDAFRLIEQRRCELISTAKFNLEFGKSGEDVILQRENGLLMLDDLGIENQVQTRYGTQTDPVSILLFLRYESRARTFCSTNLNPDRLKERYGDRLSDRFKEMFDVVQFKGESRR